MTEYDFSPEAYEHHLRKQHAITKWVRRTEEGPMRDPYTPATPAADTHPLGNDSSDQDDVRRHRPGQSYDQYERRRDRDLDRYRDRDKVLDEERVVYDRDKHKHRTRSLHHSGRPPNTKRRSASQSGTMQSVPKSHVPPPLPLPPQPWQMPYSQKLSPPLPPHPQYYPQKFTSPRDSGRSSHSSSTTRLHHSPNSYFLQPSPQHSPDTDTGYPQPVSRKGSSRVPDFTNAPQYPHSAYQVKQPPSLFQRLLKGLTGGKKQVPQRVPRRKRSFSL